MKKIRVAVVFGGQSSEHEVSRVSAQEVVGNFNREKYEVEMIGITREGRWLKYSGPVEYLADGRWQAVAEQDATAKAAPGVSAGNTARSIVTGCADVDVVFPVIHGCNGEDGTIQGLLELAGMPYVGCGVLSSALGMDKGFAKIIFEKEGIPQGDYRVVTRRDLEKSRKEIVLDAEDEFGYPCFVKPCNSGSSVGVSKAHDREELADAIAVAAEYDRRIIIEEYIEGRELECAVLGNDEPQASTAGEVLPCNEFYDYKAKYASGGKSKTLIPAAIPDGTRKRIREYAVRAFTALDCSGLARVDFFLQADSGRLLINEINTMPGFTRISMYSKLWEASGVPYREVLDRLVQLALKRHGQITRKILN